MERILDVATLLIVERGSDAFKMSDVASLAEVSIGSLYQYFPDKQSIVRSLAQRYSAQTRDCLTDALSGVTDRASLVAAFVGLVDEYQALFKEHPLMRHLSAAMRVDRELRVHELNESRWCGDRLAEAVIRVNPAATPKPTKARMFLLWQLGEETMRLAMEHSRADALEMIDAYKQMCTQQLHQMTD